ncbi:MAG: NUDIX hydrolase [Desulfobacteraceae bacterium]|nr:NUDIX hydrolase [Desulfobacteraceae bacterium]
MSAKHVSEFVRVVIKDTNNRVLVVIHRNTNSRSLNLPGGKVNSGEKPEEAVRRELLEETGMLLTSTKLVSDKHFNIDGVEWKGYFFLGESPCMTPQNMEPDKHSFVGFCDVNFAKQEGHRAFVSEPIELISHQCGW